MDRSESAKIRAAAGFESFARSRSSSRLADPGSRHLGLMPKSQREPRGHRCGNRATVRTITRPRSIGSFQACTSLPPTERSSSFFRQIRTPEDDTGERFEDQAGQETRPSLTMPHDSLLRARSPVGCVAGTVAKIRCVIPPVNPLLGFFFEFPLPRPTRDGPTSFPPNSHDKGGVAVATIQPPENRSRKKFE